MGTLFAFLAASRADVMPIPVPINCVSIGSPKVGTVSFRSAFQLLERYGKLRCLRVVNYEDLVTQMPDRSSLSCLYLFIGQRFIFRHVGMELKLFKNREFEVSYPKRNGFGLRLFLTDWKTHISNLMTRLAYVCCMENDLKYHWCSEYLKRIENSKQDLLNVRCKDLYDDVLSEDFFIA